MFLFRINRKYIYKYIYMLYMNVVLNQVEYKAVISISLSSEIQGNNFILF